MDAETSSPIHPSPPSPEEEAALVRKITYHLMPILCTLYFLSFLDRSNVSNAHADLIKDLKLTETNYATVTGVFFVGYVLFEIPSNILLVKTSPSKWIARIMVTWGAICMLQVLVQNYTGLVVVRFFFGIAEAGFTPGITYFLTLWFTKKERASKMAIFFASTAVCGLIGGFMAYGILQMDGIGGLYGWKWLFLIEGFPSILAGVFVWFFLPNHPSECKWLNEKERALAITRLSSEETENHKVNLRDIWLTLTDLRVLGCAFVYFTILTAFYTVSFFLPALMTEFGFTSLTGNLMSTPVYFFATVVMLVFAWSSDRKQERVWHLVIMGGCGAVSWGLLACACALHIFAFELTTCFLVTACTWSMIAPLLTWLMEGLRSATSSAVGAALVVAFGNIGGIAGPYILGASMDSRGNYDYGLAAIGALLAAGIIALIILNKFTKPQSHDHELLENPPKPMVVLSE